MPIKRTYQFIITIPINTIVEAERPITESDAISGKITKVTYDIPSGVAGVAGVRIEGGGFFHPSRTKGSINYLTGEDINLPSEPNVIIENETLKFYGINNSGSIAYDFIITIEVEEIG